MSVQPAIIVPSGTVALNGTVLTCNGVNLMDKAIRAGDWVNAKGFQVPVESVAWSAPNTVITLASGFPAALSAQEVRVYRVADGERQLQAQIDYLSAVSSDIIAALSGLQPEANKFPFFGPGGVGMLGDLPAIVATGVANIANASADPWLIAAGNTQSVTISPAFSDTNYTVICEITGADPSIAQAGQVEISSKATNAFTLSITGSAKAVAVRWVAIRRG